MFDRETHFDSKLSKPSARPKGFALLMVLILMVLIGLSAGYLATQDKQDRSAAKRNLALESAQHSNEGAVMIVHALLRAGTIQGYTSSEPVGTFFVARNIPVGPGQGASWSFTNGFLESDGISPTAKATVFICNPRAIPSSALGLLYSPTPNLPPPSSCTPGTVFSTLQPAAIEHDVVFVSRLADGTVQIRAEVKTRLP